MQNPTQIESYKKEQFTHKLRNGKVAKHDIYTIGNGDKVVVIIQELPGIGQETLALSDKFVARGYTVVMPHLFGPIGRTAAVRNLFQVICMRREFKLLAKNESSPVVDFLSALCSKVKAKYKVKGVAVIGMCLTGNFAISLMANEDVLAGFASQPSLPLIDKEALHLSPNDIKEIKKNLDKVGPMHCGRFEKDGFCKQEKFDLLDKTFNNKGKNRIIFHEMPGEGHAILTIHFVDKTGHPTHEALNDVFDYFDGQLN